MINKQDVIAHPTQGEGIVISKIFKRKNNIIMVYMKKEKTCEFFLESEILKYKIED